ncbi:hypothetical protein BD779DRAFT_1486393 [Infundibulicybe gibba]|nr:hypothetical protein BD779DRAFT_1486393 [Infundibulicybe gibba]
MTTITIPQGYGYVAGGILTTVPVLMIQSIIVHKYRDAAGIRYPQLYAEKTEAEASPAAAAFNRAQRAHQNTLENIPMIYVMTILSGLKYPIPSAIACAFWALSRIAYTRGYLVDAEMVWRIVNSRNSANLSSLSARGIAHCQA